MKNIFSIFDLHKLVISIFSYSLGVNFAKYLGFYINVKTMVLGYLFVIGIIISSELLYIYFHSYPSNQFIRPENEVIQKIILAVSLSIMAATPITLIILYKDGLLNISIAIMLFVFCILAYGNAIPPFHFQFFGWGEFIRSIYIAGLLPAIGFLFQQKDLNQLIIIISIPLVCLYLANFIVKNLKHFSRDLTTLNKSFVTIFTWQISLKIQNLLLVFSYLFIAFFPIFGISMKIIWPVFLSIPTAVLQIYLLLSISDGAKPNWQLLILSSNFTIALALYFMNFSFYIN